MNLFIFKSDFKDEIRDQSSLKGFFKNVNSFIKKY